MSTDLAQELVRAQRLVGRILAEKYCLRGCVGIGGSGAVFKADQVTLGRTVAVKVLNEALAQDPRLVKRFHDEALAASRLNHPNTVSVIDYGQTSDGLLYLVMEFLRGPTLTRLLADGFPIAHERILDVVGQILAGVEEAHLAGIVHCDLKCDNIIIDQRRSGWDAVKVVDFGIARLVSQPVGDERTVCGTPEYMAPEVITGTPPTFASDLYSVGIILYEMLTGQTPFVGGTTTDVLTRHLKQAAQPPSAARPDLDISPELDELCLRALSKHPRDRWPSAGEMRARVQHLREGRRRASTGADVDCAHCGAHIAASFRFCPECGQSRQAAAAVVAQDPGQALRGITVPLVGRERVIREIAGHMTSTQRPTAVLFFGSSAAERAAILRAAFARMGEGVTIYQATGDPSGLATAFFPVRALVAAVLELPPVCSNDDLLAAVVAVGLSARDLPGVAELFAQESPLTHLEPLVRRRELITATLRVLRAAPRRGRAVIALEDVERYDQPSLEIVRRLAEDSGDVRVVVSTSSAAATGWPPLRRLELEPLTVDDLPEIVRHMARDGVPLVSAQALHGATAGSVEHLEHLIRFVVEGGRFDDAPALLPDVVAARLSMLPHDARILCQALAVFGLEAQRDDLRRVTETQVDDLEGDALEALLVRNLVRDDAGIITFTSQLVRDVAYDGIPADVRRALHAKVASTLELVIGDPAVLGCHYAAAGQRDRAVELLERAGDIAVHQYDEEGASSMYQRAVSLARLTVYAGDDDGDGVERYLMLSVKLAESLRVRGQTVLARGVIAEAKPWSGGLPRLEAQLARASAHLLLSESDHPAAATSLRRGIGLAISAGDGVLVSELYLDLAALLIRTGEAASARREIEEGIALVTGGDGPSSESGPANVWRLVLRLGQLVEGAGEYSQAIDLAGYALVHARRGKSRLGAARAQSYLADLCDRVGRSDEAKLHRQAAVEQMRKLGDRRGTAELLLSSTTRNIQRIPEDQLAEARDLAQEIGWSEGTMIASSDRPTLPFNHG